MMDNYRDVNDRQAKQCSIMTCKLVTFFFPRNITIYVLRGVAPLEPSSVSRDVIRRRAMHLRIERY